jgi:hypothetical protein
MQWWCLRLRTAIFWWHLVQRNSHYYKGSPVQLFFLKRVTATGLGFFFEKYFVFSTILSNPFRNFDEISYKEWSVSFCRCLYHVLCSDYAEFSLHDMGNITSTNYMNMSCKKYISISACGQKMHINDVTMKKNVMTNKSIVKYFRILSSFTTAILAW